MSFGMDEEVTELKIISSSRCLRKMPRKSLITLSAIMTHAAHMFTNI